MTNEFDLVFAKHKGKFTLVPFCELTNGDYLPTIHRTIAGEPHLSTFDDWLLYDDKDVCWFPEDLAWNDEDLEELWAEFGDVPMNPETECIELDWLHFPAGTNREEIWHWFEDTFDCRVADLMYGVRESRRTEAPFDEASIQITFNEEDIERFCEKFYIRDKEDLYRAVWECINTYMEM